MMKVSVILGTRPEAVKLCPLILALEGHDAFLPHVCLTGQHQHMLDHVLDAFDVRADVNLNLMQVDQSLASFTSRAIVAVDGYLADYKPDLVIVQGDTTTVFCAALAAFYRRIPVAHVEAGLRTGDKFSPYPEEANRALTARLADYHFAPTEQARDNLLAEGISGDNIVVTGNTVIDALNIAVEKVRSRPPYIAGLPTELMHENSGLPVVLITGHRRENFGKRFEAICSAIGILAERFTDTAFVYPVHLNPNVRRPVYSLLSKYKNIHLLEPLPYLSFVAMMDRATLILTDSGGVQEEAPSLGKPVLVMRDTTERPEGTQAGAAKLVGTETDCIVDAVTKLLTNREMRAAMSCAVSPYGDGRACDRIIAELTRSTTVLRSGTGLAAV